MLLDIVGCCLMLLSFVGRCLMLLVVVAGEAETKLDASELTVQLPMPSRQYEVYGSLMDADGTTFTTTLIAQVKYHHTHRTGIIFVTQLNSSLCVPQVKYPSTSQPPTGQSTLYSESGDDS